MSQDCRPPTQLKLLSPAESWYEQGLNTQPLLTSLFKVASTAAVCSCSLRSLTTVTAHSVTAQAHSSPPNCLKLQLLIGLPHGSRVHCITRVTPFSPDWMELWTSPAIPRPSPPLHAPGGSPEAIRSEGGGRRLGPDITVPAVGGHPFSIRCHRPGLPLRHRGL